MEEQAYGNRDAYLRANSSFSLTRTGINIGKYDKNSSSYLLFTTNDGKLKIKGEIEATSLTLGPDVKLDLEHLPDIVIPDNVLTTDILNPDNVITTDDIEVSEEVELDTKTGRKYRKLTVGGSTYSIITNDDFVFTDFAYGDPTVKEDEGKLVKISKTGLLEAHNALIYGNIYATNGSFNGKITSQEASIGTSDSYMKFDPTDKKLKVKGEITSDSAHIGDTTTYLKYDTTNGL